MGYTHYWRHAQLPFPQWMKVVDDSKKLFGILPEHSHTSGDCYGEDPLKIQFEEDDKRPPVADEDIIRFNGVGELAHETFYLERRPHNFNGVEAGWDGKSAEGFAFCKTARKPYDFAAQCVLLFALHHFGPEVFKLSSDGDDEDWQVAKDFVKEHFGYEFGTLFKE